MSQPAGGEGGGTDLKELIQSMCPSLDSNTAYVFAKIPHTSSAPKLASLLEREAELEIKMLFRESEAWTVILSEAAAAREGLESAFPCRMVTLNVHSSLEAVGFLAAVTTRLAQRLKTGINPVSGFYHDHLFVPEGLEGAVVEQLKNMAAEEK